MTTKARPAKHKKASANRIFVVATNSEYAKLCVSSLKRLPPNANVELLSYPQVEPVKFATHRPQSTLVVSRLSDVTKKVLEIASAGAATKQLVFLEGLPVQAMASRLMPLNIRNPERIHIAASRDQSAIEELIYRLVSGLTEKDGSHPIVDAWIENEQLVLLSPAFARLDVPLAKLARFIGTDKTKTAAFEIDADGRYLYWPHADVHLGWTHIQQIIDPASLITAARKTSEYNRRYGAAIRAIRESYGLKQAAVQGITERQLRRVEQGQQSASRGTLEALANAHALSLEEYLERLAKTARSID